MPFALAFALQALPLPEKSDIPTDFATVICPSEDAARMMLHSYYDVKDPPRNHTIDVTHFFAGLKETGCVQNGPLADTVITITEVLDRRTIMLADGPSVIAAYRGTNAAGQAVIGVVDESDNNTHPRTPLESWIRTWASEGYVEAKPGALEYNVIWQCPSLAAADKAVAAIPKNASEKKSKAGFAAGLKKQGCKTAFGRYTVTALGKQGNYISCGYECGYSWRALEAKSLTGGATVGLIFNDSEM